MPSMEVHSQTPSYDLLWNKAINSSKPNLNELINFDWTINEQSVNNFIDFLVNLVSYNSTFAFESFNVLIGAFEPYKISIKNGIAVQYEKWEMIALKVHFSLNKILSIIPLSSSILAKLLCEKFPHRTHPAEVQHFYLKNALYVTRYCPTISATILSSAISTLIQIDASITLDSVPDDEDLQFEIENQQNLTTAQQAQLQQVQEDKANAQKLDILMNLMLDYLSIRFAVAKKDSGNIFYFAGCEQQDTQSQDELFRNLINIFDLTILPTYKSKYTQYLLFFTCSLYQRTNTFPPLNTNQSLLNQNPTTTTTTPISSTFLNIPHSKLESPKKSSLLSTSTSPSKKLKSFLKMDPVLVNSGTRILYAESFIRYLFSKLCNDKIHNMYRHSCAAYIGSFVSRASFLPPHIIKMAFRDLLNFAIQYVDRFDRKELNCYPDPQLHSLFYSICQSVYYIFCFRNQVILDFTKDFKNDRKDDKQREFWQDLNEALRKISTSRLNPFKICLKSVVRQFCGICLRVGIFTKCTLILKNNKKVSFNSKTTTGHQNQFDSFFPFDPYILFHSSRFFTNTYIHWKAVMKDDDEENLDDLSDDDEDEDLVLNDNNSSSDSEFSDFQSSEDEDEDDKEEKEESSSDDEDEEVDQLTEDFMSFTPELRYDLKYHFKNREY